jgi:hypothetical protein
LTKNVARKIDPRGTPFKDIRKNTLSTFAPAKPTENVPAALLPARPEFVLIRWSAGARQEMLRRADPSGSDAAKQQAQLSGSHTMPHAPLQQLQCAGWPKVLANCHSCASLLH